MQVESSARRPSSRALSSVVLFVIMTAVSACLFGTWRHDDRSPVNADDVPEVAEREPVTSHGSGRRALAVRPGASVLPSAGDHSIGAAVPQLSSANLAAAWLRGFLTRDDRNDVRWIAAIEPLSTSAVVEDLRAAGPDAVGLQQLSSWRVERIEHVGDVDPAMQTPTRQVLPYAATVTDGVRKAQKPFVLYAYLDPEGSWRIGDVEQPYSSEG